MSEQAESSAGKKREKHDKPDDFGRALAEHALEAANRKKAGKDPKEPVTYDATVTVTSSDGLTVAGSWTVCVNLGFVSVCYNF